MELVQCIMETDDLGAIPAMTSFTDSRGLQVRIRKDYGH